VLLTSNSSLGEGAFSQVFKVKRISDGVEYALKKVSFSLIYYY